MKVIAIVLAASLLPCLVAAPEADKAKALGSPSAPVTIEIFSDFQCPMCKSFHEGTLPLLMKDYVLSGKVYIVSREFPLNRSDHPYARAAAVYATAAARIGQYGPVTDAMFKGQESWEKTGKLWEAVAAVLTPDQQKRVQALAKDPAVLKEVQADVDYGTAIVGVAGTPTLYLSRVPKRSYAVTGAALGYGLLRSLIDDFAK